jgi:hypothetical protein
MPRRDPVQQLRALNEVLARSASSDPECAEHARRALDFFSAEQAQSETPQTPICQSAIGNCARELARLHFGDSSEGPLVFTHWHVPGSEECDPLWVRQAVVTEMKRLAGRRAGLLLVTGLREALCPTGSYWTQARQARYQQICDWIDTLACAWASRGSQLQVVVI